MTRQSRAIGESLRAHTTRAIQTFTLEILRNLRRNPSRGGTPVDTGHARANWTLSAGAPAFGAVTGKGDGGVASVIAWDLGDGPLFVNNNAPYILRLNDGHSKQAPAGFIERAIDEALAMVNRKFRDASIVIGTADSIGGDAASNLASAYSPFGDD